MSKSSKFVYTVTVTVDGVRVYPVGEYLSLSDAKLACRKDCRNNARFRWLSGDEVVQSHDIDGLVYVIVRLDKGIIYEPV